jgi:aryl-alcohol dehydrogenase-like predicted oxidoreductase
METRTLGRTGIPVSHVGFGTGGYNAFGQSRGGTPEDAAALAETALDLGISFFDTAAAYKESEVLLGAALEGVPRSSYVLGSKVQPRRDGTFLTADEVDAAIDRSRERLRVDTIDVFMVHALAVGDYDRVLDEHLPVLERARREGRIRATGLTESFAGDDPLHLTLRRAVDDGAFDVLMVGYNVVHQNAERDILPIAADKGIGIIVMAAVRRALARREATEALVAELKASGELGPDDLPDEDPLGWLVGEGGSPSVQAACYRFAAWHPAVSTVLTGTFDPAHLAENVAAVELGPLPDDQQARLRRTFGHLELGLGR